MSAREVEEVLLYLQSRLPVAFQGEEAIRFGVVCGSGLGGLVDLFDQSTRVEVPYETIPNFPQSTVAGHASKLVFGHFGAQRIPGVAMLGRFHFYEGYDMSKIALPIRVMRSLGARILILTNAAGALNPDFNVGDLVVINDHINLPGLAGNHPLRGPNQDEFGPRFPALSDAYSLDLRRSVFSVSRAQDTGFSGRRALHEGTYAFVSGPTFETTAEARMLKALGADVVGMSTVPEVVVGRHCGLHVLCISLVTNKVVCSKPPSVLDPTAQDVQEPAANHEEVIAASNEAANDLQALIAGVLTQGGTHPHFV